MDFLMHPVTIRTWIFLCVCAVLLFDIALNIVQVVEMKKNQNRGG